MCDRELDVVHDGCELVRGRAVGSQQRDLAEALAAKALRGGPVDLLPVTLANWAFLPGDSEPLEIADDLLLAARDVARRVGVVDSQQ